ncbi:MAG: HYExAFE family protein [Pirellulales bacterium]
MAKRDNHYEAAFEAWLRDRRLPYVAVDEARRSRFPGGSIKSLDFIVSPPGECSWLVDVKGRRFPSGDGKQYWKNWSTRDDLVSLARWQRWFGQRFGGLFVFAYNVVGNRSPLPAERLLEFRGGLYAFVGIRLQEYAMHARVISPKWGTLAMPAAHFRQLAAPVEEFFDSQNLALV